MRKAHPFPEVLSFRRQICRSGQSDKIVGFGFFHRGLDHAAGNQPIPADISEAVNFRGLEPGSSLEKSRPFLVGTVHQNVQLLPFLLPENVRTDAGLDAHDGVPPPLFDRAGQLPGQGGRGRTVFRVIRENTYFFRASKYVPRLIEHYEKHLSGVMPRIRYNEIMSFLRGEVRDQSVSRTTLKWGIPIPGDEKHVIYVWFDALINYTTAVGYPVFFRRGIYSSLRSPLRSPPSSQYAAKNSKPKRRLPYLRPAPFSAV